MTYAELEQAIQDYCQNDETTFVANINNFIISAEDKIFMSLESREFWNSSSGGTFTDNVKDYSLNAASAATGAIDILSIYCLGGDASTDGRSLKLKDYSFIKEAYPLNTGAESKAMPKYYAVKGLLLDSGEPSVQFTVGPTPDASYGYLIEYFAKPTTDTITNGNTPGDASTDKTWLSVTFPSLLLDGAVAEGYRFMKSDQPDIDRFDIPFQSSLVTLKNFEEVRLKTDTASQMSTDPKNIQR